MGSQDVGNVDALPIVDCEENPWPQRLFDQFPVADSDTVDLPSHYIQRPLRWPDEILTIKIDIVFVVSHGDASYR